MAEGFDESKMKDSDIREFKNYTDDQLDGNYEDLLSEMDGLLKRGGNRGPVHVQMRYDAINRILDAIDHEKRLRFRKQMDKLESKEPNVEDSYSFIDSDDGETVIINGVVKTPAVKFIPSDNVEFGDIDSGLYDILDEEVHDNENILDESKYDDIMTRLKNVKTKNKADIDDQFERVIAVTKVIQRKYNVNLNPNNIVAKEILNRTVVHRGRDGTDTLFFKRKLADGRLSKRTQLVLKTGNEYSSAKNSEVAVSQFKELINQYEESSLRSLLISTKKVLEYLLSGSLNHPLRTTHWRIYNLIMLTERVYPRMKTES